MPDRKILTRRVVANAPRRLSASPTHLNNLAMLLAERGDWVQAVALGRRAKPILTRLRLRPTRRVRNATAVDSG